MELIIVSILFVALMACWFILPGHSENTYALSASEPVAVAPVKHTA
jgi:hypothetical protein